MRSFGMKFFTLLQNIYKSEFTVLTALSNLLLLLRMVFLQLEPKKHGKSRLHIAVVVPIPQYLLFRDEVSFRSKLFTARWGTLDLVILLHVLQIKMIFGHHLLQRVKGSNMLLQGEALVIYLVG